MNLLGVGQTGQEIKGPRFFRTGVQPLVDPLGEPSEEGLDDLHQNNQDHHRDPHHRGDEPLVAVPHGDVAQAAGAHSAGNGGVAQVTMEMAPPSTREGFASGR